MVRAQLACVWSVLALAAGCSSDPKVPPISAAGGMVAAAGSAGTAPVGGGGVTGAAGSASAGASGNATTAGTSNAGGNAGTAGSPATGGSGGASAGGGGAGGAGGMGGSIMMLEPCADPAVSHLKVWEMQVVGGTMVPANGSPLRKYDGGGYEMHVEWTLNGAGPYGTANAPLNNQGQYANGADPAKNAVDISKGSGVTIEYSSDGSTYLQIRTATVPHGGDHFKADLPSTSGQFKTITLDYASFRRPGGTTPPGPDILKDAFSFTFVGSATTKLTLRQVLTPGFIPPCN